MDHKTLELLEYKKIQELLAGQAGTPMGRSLARNAFPVNASLARDRQKVGREIAGALLKVSSPSIAEVPDVRTKVSGVMQGVVLTPPDIRDVLNVLVAFDTVSIWIGRLGSEFTGLHRLNGRVPQLPFLRGKLDEIVDGQGEIKDTASARLLSIRKSLREFQERLRKRAEEMTRQKAFSDYLQEPIVTIRNGRYVLPVKQEYASRVQGIVHDQSASGQTLFLEPSELVEMANQLKRLELMERDEIERILAEASAFIAEVGQDLLDGLEALGEFDLGLAKARLLSKWNGCFPQLRDSFVLSLVKAWHPLLKGKPVPLDLSLDESGDRTIVVTGPNMGGKTVTLKTCGLLVAMALAGMPCPCDSRTEIGNIEEILCDIGDEQSIEENLSTFSAHMTNVKHILASASRGSLVLIDELGAGTDPREGAALAQAILEKIHNSGALCVITSHYGDLKIMAQKTMGMANASMEWDSVNMVPTFRLVVGRPGRSNAFLVARRLGLDEDVLARARESMEEDVVKLEDVIAEMEAASQEARQEAERVSMESSLYEQLRIEYESKLAAMEADRKKIINDAKREAQSILVRARVEFEKALREVKESRRKTTGEASTSTSAIRNRLLQAQGELAVETEEEHTGEPVAPEEIQPGLQVQVSGFTEPGTVLEVEPSGDHVLVQIGAFKLRTEIGNLRNPRHRPKPKAARPEISTLPGEKAQSISYEVDLRGMNREEAFLELDKYLDDALLASLPQIRIIHGKGTGVLRKAVEEYLQSKGKYIAGYRMGEVSEGGTGVTVAKLRN